MANEGKWWRREVVTKGSGDEGKWWRREVVRKGSGDRSWSGDRSCMNVACSVLWGGSRSGMAASRSHGLSCGEEAGARNLVFFRVKWLHATMQGATCGWGRFMRELVPPLCSATSGCVCLRSSMLFLKLWLQIALEWLHECCMGFVLGRKPEHETLYFFPCKVAAAGDERYLVCAVVVAVLNKLAVCVCV